MASTAAQQSSSADDRKVIEKFKAIVRSNGISDPVSEIIIKDVKGDGFASITKLVTVTFENGKRKLLNLFVKVPTPGPSHTEMLEEMKAFGKEARFLFDYLPAAKEMCRQKGRDGFIDFYPKCYFADETITVLENLVLDKGYEVIDKALLQDLEAAKFSVTTLAKHHAVAHIMIQETGGADKFFKRFPDLDYESYDKPLITDLWEPCINNSIKSHLKVLQASNIPGATEAALKLESYLGKPYSNIVLKALNKRDDNPFLVLCHGDYWNNNTMFQRDKETKKLVHHVAIDFQVTRYNSPSCDLGYYLYTSVQMKVRQNHLNELLKLYTDTVNTVTEDLGHATNLTFQNVLMDFRKRVGFGFWLGITMAVGPGMTVYKDVDISAIDLKDRVKVLDNLMLTWLEENPDKRDDMAAELVSLMNEYESLKVD